MSAAHDSVLTLGEVRRLTLWKARYRLETHGFSADQATRLIFLRWLVASGRLES